MNYKTAATIALLLFGLIIAGSAFAQGGMAHEVTQKEYWALYKYNPTAHQVKGSWTLHIESLDTATYNYYLYREKKKWGPDPPPVPVTTIVNGVDAVTFQGARKDALTGDLITTANAVLTYNVNGGTGKTKITFNYAIEKIPNATLTLTASGTNTPLTLAPSGAWGTYKNVSFSIPVIKGIQTITIKVSRDMHIKSFTLE